MSTLLSPAQRVINIWCFYWLEPSGGKKNEFPFLILFGVIPSRIWHGEIFLDDELIVILRLLSHIGYFLDAIFG